MIAKTEGSQKNGVRNISTSDVSASIFLTQSPDPGVRIQLKAWVIDEAQRCGRKPGAIYMRIYRGRYPGLKLDRQSPFVVWVTAQPTHLTNGYSRAWSWIAEEAARAGVTIPAIYNRLRQGKYPGISLRRVGRGKQRK